jgi:carboxymethylenebutenolidase
MAIYEGLLGGEVTFTGHNGDKGNAYHARPTAEGKVPGVVVIHHAPGWDEWCAEVSRKFAQHGYAAIAPNLYFRDGPGAPDDIAAKARAAGGVADDQVVGDVSGAMAWLRAQPNASGKVGVIGFCSGGRQTFLVACRAKGVDAAIDCWGGNVVVDDPSLLTPRRPVAPIEYADKLGCPLLGLFGNDDTNPNREHVDRLEATLKKLGKNYEFHRYDGAGHAFMSWYRPHYRVEQAVDAWKKVLGFYGRHLKAA